MRDRNLYVIVGAIGVVILVSLLAPRTAVSSRHRHELITITTPCVLSRYNQQTLTWEKLSHGAIQSRDFLATSEEGCEMETSVGALELGPNTVVALEKSSDGWTVDVREGRVKEIGSHNWIITSPALHAAPLWYSPVLRGTKKRL